jgi:hypothetical protein
MQFAAAQKERMKLLYLAPTRAMHANRGRLLPSTGAAVVSARAGGGRPLETNH